MDGVMIPAKPWKAHEVLADGFGMFSKHSIEGLNNILNSCNNPEIILTTSHRDRFSEDKWKDILETRGIVDVVVSIIDSNNSEGRHEEVWSWYLKNQNTSFIVIDDDKRLNSLDNNFKEDHLILTKPMVGLNEISVREALSKISRLEELEEA